MVDSNHSTLARRLTKELQGEVLFDNFSRGRYSTDASIYQIQPIGVTVPKTEQDVQIALQIAVNEGIPVLPRGAGTSQTGQAIGEALILDTTKHLNQILEFDAEARTVCVQPGMVLDHLNNFLKPHGLFFPVDVSTANRATLGGMTGNNSCGSRSIRYGNMVHNVHAIDGLLADGSQVHFKTLHERKLTDEDPAQTELIRKMLALGDREAAEIAQRFPDLLRRVGGYNIDVLTQQSPNMSSLAGGFRGHTGIFPAHSLEITGLAGPQDSWSLSLSYLL